MFRLFVAVNRPNNRIVVLLGFLALKPHFPVSLACARVVVAKFNFTHWRKLRDAHILGIGTGDCTKVRSSLLSAILRFAFKTWI
ncbi:hypothetical protein [Acinetobacter junii]|uniref:hypothetical protein n=1 Tax=Acinetobacter junii TaxID=40215 RepID=UPI001BA57CA3|nr:hypothetical protein [Acinetobacter junii]QUS49232.1 hypothetical protein J5N61_12095 [Acinetobacter junii]